MVVRGCVLPAPQLHGLICPWEACRPHTTPRVAQAGGDRPQTVPGAGRSAGAAAPPGEPAATRPEPVLEGLLGEWTQAAGHASEGSCLPPLVWSTVQGGRDGLAGKAAKKF